MLSGKCSSAGFATAWRKWPLSEAAAEAARCYGPDDGTTITTVGGRDRHEDALAHGAVLRNSARVGSSIWTVDPLPCVDSTQMRPLCICLVMASPRPVPP